MVDIVVMNGRGKIKEGSVLTFGSRQSTLARWQSTNPLFLKYLLKGLPHCEDIKKKSAFLLSFFFLQRTPSGIYFMPKLQREATILN